MTPKSMTMLSMLMLLWLVLLIPSVSYGQRRSGPSRNPNVSNSIRRVDFRNFTYPIDDYNAKNYRTNNVRIRNGRFIFNRKSDYGPDGFAVTKIIYGDLTGDGREEAAVNTAIGFIDSRTASASPSTYTYIYTMENGRPVLLKVFDAVDSDAARYYENYYRDKTFLLWGGVTKIEREVLVVESQSGAGRCCPEYEVTMRFRWDGQRLVLAGQPQRK